MEALHDLVRSGKVRYIGASSMWATQFARMQFVAEQRGWTKFVSMQNQYSLLYREEEREMNRFCNDTGVGLIPVCHLPFLPHSVVYFACNANSVASCYHIADTILSGHLSAAAISPVPSQHLAAPPGPHPKRRRASPPKTTRPSSASKNSLTRRAGR